jgi:hypothetical protein
MASVLNFRARSREECDTSIGVGDRVRSYDFEYYDNCYVEGVVEKIIPVEGCDRYCIQADRRVAEDKVYTENLPVFMPPLNGTRVAGTFEYTNGVRKIDAA